MKEVLLSNIKLKTTALADLGGRAPRMPPKGPDSFVLTYKIFETLPPRGGRPPRGRRPLREILDLPLNRQADNNNNSRKVSAGQQQYASYF